MVTRRVPDEKVRIGVRGRISDKVLDSNYSELPAQRQPTLPRHAVAQKRLHSPGDSPRLDGDGSPATDGDSAPGGDQDMGRELPRGDAPGLPASLPRGVQGRIKTYNHI